MGKRVLLIGGLGFIGYHTSRLLSNKGYDVSIGYRSSEPKGVSDYGMIRIDLSSMSHEILADLISRYDYVVFCGGADDRKKPVGDATEFYYHENVIPCKKLVLASNETGIKKVIILGSYFSYFDRNRPAWKLKERHVYIQSRHLQLEESKALAKEGLEVSSLEIPYVFGATPGMIPLWKPLINYVRISPIIFYTKGGTNIMSVEQVGQAIVGVLETEQYKSQWIIGSENVTWTELLGMISKGLGKRRRVITLPTWLLKIIGFKVKVLFALISKKMGLDIYHFMDVQTANTFLDLEETMKYLNYDRLDMQESINETIKACGYGVIG